MVEPRHPLLQNGKGSIAGWHDAASEITALAQAHQLETALVRRAIALACRGASLQEQAAVRHGFAHRFLLAGREVCVLRRLAFIAQLKDEQQAALRNVRDKVRIEQRSLQAGSIAALRGRQREEKSNQLNARRAQWRRAVEEASVRSPGRAQPGKPQKPSELHR